jgi:hypothetical protein
VSFLLYVKHFFASVSSHNSLNFQFVERIVQTNDLTAFAIFSSDKTHNFAEKTQILRQTEKDNVFHSLKEKKMVRNNKKNQINYLQFDAIVKMKAFGIEQKFGFSRSKISPIISHVTLFGVFTNTSKKKKKRKGKKKKRKEKKAYCPNERFSSFIKLRNLT